MGKIRILVIEDDKVDQMAFKRIVKDEGLSYDYDIAGSVSEAKKFLDSKRFDIVITDYMLGDGTAFDILDLIKDTPIIIVTGSGDEEIAVKAMKRGAYDYLIKDPERNYLKVLPITVESAIKHKGAEKQFRMLSHAIMSINDSVYITDMDNRIIFVNKAFCKTYGHEEGNILGRDSNVLGEVSLKDEFYHRRKDGSTFPVSLSRSAIKDESGNEVAVIGVVRDITEHKRAEEELKKAKEAAEVANSAKSQFLAVMSHEIRTPMNAIIGMADLLWETNLTPEQREYVRIFRRAGDSLLNLINDLLDLSKVEAGRLELENIGFDLCELIEKTVEILAVRAHEKGIELNFYISPDVPTNLVGDPKRLSQILINLVGNAIKFTEKGEVLLSVENNNETKDGICLLFSIRDTGIGIPSERLSVIFDNFTQVDSSITRKYGGTGLGLSISKKLVELMKGSIWVESRFGEGSTFYFTAQFGIQSEPKPISPPPPADLKGLRTLVVDDNATNRFILREMLSGWGALVTEAESGEQGLVKLKQAEESGVPYRLLLLDRRMPGIDGFELAEYIKKDLGTTGMTILMLTSDNRQNDIKCCQELGISAYLVKPIKRYDLINTISGAINKTEVTPEEPQIAEKPTASDDQHALSILLAEDSEDNRLLIQSYLKNTPHQIDIAENGEIAVEKFKTGKYDIVLMDIQMPVMDGYSATQMIRKWEKDKGLKSTPIVALTAHALKEEKQKSIDSGCTSHITKPVKKRILMEAIHQYTTIGIGR
ncbi:MAG: hybrid sensor histidine kinase/response regulator [Candidatus Dadabacteria bacterium]